MKRTKVTIAVSALVFVLSLAAAPAQAVNGDCGVIATGGSKPFASDCLGILQHAVSKTLCAPYDPCVCDVDGSGSILASDALLCLNVAVGNPAFSLHCTCSGTTTTTIGTVSTTSTSSTSWSVTTSSSTSTTLLTAQPSLTAGDFPSVSPCSDRDTLPDDAAFLAAVSAATEADLVVNFTQYDTDGLPEICGLNDTDNALDPSNVAWDPSRGNGLGVCNGFTADVADFFNTVPLGHGPDLCQTGNNTFTLAMPRAGTYRKDSCIESGGNGYDVRTRISVSGASVDATFASLGISRSDLKACDGSTEIATQAAAKAFVAANPRAFSFAIKSGSCSGGTQHLSVTAEIICVKDRGSACPAPDYPCF